MNARMNTAPETIGQEHFKALRLHRPLLPIEQFAAREGTTVEEIKKCGKIGIVQLRKHNGKTYVVDIPYCCYEANAAADAEVAELIGNSKQPPVKQTAPQKQPHSPEKNHTQAVKPGSISELVNRMIRKSGKLKADPAGQDTSLPQATEQLVDSINTQLDHIEHKIKNTDADR